MTHVTINATDLRVRGRMESHKLRLHDRVTCLSAKLDRLGVLVSAITSEGARANKDEREREDHEREAALSWLVQINFRIGQYLPIRRPPSSASLEQHPNQNNEQSKTEERRQHDVRDDAEVWVIRRLRQLDQKQQQNTYDRRDYY